MCQNTTMRLYGAWIKSYCVLFSKTFSTLDSLLWFPVGSRQAARGAPIGETRFMTPGIFRQTNSNGQVGFWPGDSYGTKRMTEKDINSSNAGDGIIRLWRSIPCLLMHWLLKLPVHQLAWHWLCTCIAVPVLISSTWVKPTLGCDSKCEYIFYNLKN